MQLQRTTVSGAAVAVGLSALIFGLGILLLGLRYFTIGSGGENYVIQTF